MIPTWPEVECLDAGWNRDWVLEAYAGADGTSEIYEDDGVSLAHEKGVSARTPLTLKDSAESVRLTIGQREGRFKDGPQHRVTVVVHGLAGKPSSATVGGKPVEGKWNADAKTFTVGPFEVGAAGCELNLLK